MAGEQTDAADGAVIRRFGYKPDLYDARDRTFAVRRPSLDAPPRRASVWDSRCAIKEQARSNSCVGQGVSQATRLAYLYAGKDCPELSARFNYRLALNIDKSTDDGGTHIRSAVTAAKALGLARESEFPFEDSRVLEPIGLDAVHDAHDLRGIRGYYRIPSGDVEDIKRALAAGFPCVAGWPVSQEFLDWDGIDPIPAQTTNIVGRHAMVIATYDGDVFDLANSWGRSWSTRDGFAIVSRGFVAQAQDCWAIDVQEAP